MPTQMDLFSAEPTLLDAACLSGEHHLRTTHVKVPKEYLAMPWAKPADAP